MKAECVDIFLSLMQSASISGTARLLNISQSTVSNRLSMLEEEVGGRLFHRSRGQKAALPTDLAFQFLPLAEAWQTLNRKTRSFCDPNPMGQLTVGSLETLNTYLLDHFYSKIVFDDPCVPYRLHIRTRTATDLYTLLRAGQIDIGLTVHSIYVPGTEITPLFSERFVLLGPRELRQDQLKVQDEVYMPWERAFHEWHVEHYGEPHHCAINVDLMPLALRFLKKPGAWIFAPISVAKRVATELNMAIFELAAPPPERVCYKLTSKQPMLDRAEALKDFQQRLDRFLETCTDFTLL